jgi:hypothetical protein
MKLDKVSTTKVYFEQWIVKFEPHSNLLNKEAIFTNIYTNPHWTDARYQFMMISLHPMHMQGGFMYKPPSPTSKRRHDSFENVFIPLLPYIYKLPE